MLIAHPRQRVYLAVGATDLRKAVDGLAAIVQADFQLSPFEPCLFAFCNRRKDRVKILEWSPQGFWLHYFRYGVSTILQPKPLNSRDAPHVTTIQQRIRRR